MNYYNPYELYHHGVKGQKWGVRRYRKTNGQLTNAGKERYSAKVRTKTGKEISIIQDKNSAFVNALSKISGKFRKEQDKNTICSLYADNKKIGDLHTYQESPKSLNVVWIGVNKRQRGQGIAKAVMEQTIKAAKEKGYKQITLEVPGESPDARHIYESLGFKEVGTVTDADEDLFWGGLTAMRLKL